MCRQLCLRNMCAAAAQQLLKKFRRYFSHVNVTKIASIFWDLKDGKIWTTSFLFFFFYWILIKLDHLLQASYHINLSSLLIQFIKMEIVSNLCCWLCFAAQICACLHSTTATEEKHAHTTQGQICVCHSVLSPFHVQKRLCDQKYKIQLIYIYNLPFGWTTQGPQG